MTWHEDKEASLWKRAEGTEQVYVNQYGHRTCSDVCSKAIYIRRKHLTHTLSHTRARAHTHRLTGMECRFSWATRLYTVERISWLQGVCYCSRSCTNYISFLMIYLHAFSNADFHGQPGCIQWNGWCDGREYTSDAGRVASVSRPRLGHDMKTRKRCSLHPGQDLD